MEVGPKNVKNSESAKQKKKTNNKERFRVFPPGPHAIINEVLNVTVEKIRLKSECIVL